MKHILIADDHSIVRLGLKMLVRETIEDCNIEFADSFENILLMLQEKKYDLLITDVNMPKAEGVISISGILQAQAGIKILVLSVNPENIFAKRYLKAGVFGYVQKNNSDENIRDAIRIIMLGKRYFSPELMQLLSENYLGEVADNPFDKLSDREFEVAMLLLRGFGLNEVANTLNLHTSTASTYKVRLFEKLGISNLVELVSLSAVHNIVEDPKLIKN
jgi:two-component system invasion response regulator UvrY